MIPDRTEANDRSPKTTLASDRFLHISDQGPRAGAVVGGGNPSRSQQQIEETDWSSGRLSQLKGAGQSSREEGALQKGSSRNLHRGFLKSVLNIKMCTCIE